MYDTGLCDGMDRSKDVHDTEVCTELVLQPDDFLVSLSTTQVYGSTHLTIGADANGNCNESDAMIFLKNIGSNADRVNAVETLYSASPASMYIDLLLQFWNMLIMTYAHTRATGDGSLISRYNSLLTS
ncbi:hypothetical protein H4582DRAFT_2044093 [Lactarius indigo]|nr:hypothetical protein H4582DRAFT_2044093 [Lactarius indigo]